MFGVDTSDCGGDDVEKCGEFSRTWDSNPAVKAVIEGCRGALTWFKFGRVLNRLSR